MSVMSEPEHEQGGGERMLRDMERWKDRVEVSLDNRQVFFLFFGSAVVACLIFVLGVMVGKRLEARARDQIVPMKSDPLAALDQTADDSDEPVRPEPKPKAAPSAQPRAVAAPPAPKVEPRPEAKVEPRPEAKVEPKAEPPRPALLPKLAPLPGAKPEAKPDTKLEPKASEPVAVSAEKLASASKAAARYTLQLSAFQERSEAEDFAKKLTGTGYKANIVAADIPGRGVWYRVRVGDFSSQKAALDAKADIERKLHIIAYVTRL